MADDRLAHVQRLNASADIRIERRHLSPDDFGRLLDATRTGKTRCGLSGEHRELLYLTAAYTGLRASELASLTPSSFDLASDPPMVVVEAGDSKHRQRDELPLHPELASRLRQWFAQRRETTNERPATVSIDGHSDASDGPLWPGRWAMDRRGWRMVKADLQAAGIPYRDDAGRQFDFHALRHQFISMLAAAGVHPKTAQELARHSTITLTMDHYSHVGVRDLSAALDTLPSLMPARESQAATGTDDARPGFRSAHQTAHFGDIRCDSMRSIETRGASQDAPDERSTSTQNPHVLQGIEADCASVRTIETRRKARVDNGTRTRDLRNHNPAL